MKKPDVGEDVITGPGLYLTREGTCVRITSLGGGGYTACGNPVDPAAWPAETGSVVDVRGWFVWRCETGHYSSVYEHPRNIVSGPHPEMSPDIPQPPQTAPERERYFAIL